MLVKRRSGSSGPMETSVARHSPLESANLHVPQSSVSAARIFGGSCDPETIGVRGAPDSGSGGETTGSGGDFRVAKNAAIGSAAKPTVNSETRTGLALVIRSLSCTA